MTKKRKEQGEKLLQAAYDLVAEVGVGGLRTREIAEKAGVNLATLHYCFASKDALLEALYDFILAQFRAESEKLLSLAHSAAETQKTNSELRLRFLREAPKAVRVWRAFIGEAWTNPTVAQITRRHFAEQRARLSRMIALGRADGTFTNLPTPDDTLAASMLMGLYDGLMFQAALDPEAFVPEEYARAIAVWLGRKPPA